MLTGTLKSLIHLSQSTFTPGTRLVADRNDKGYGVIEDPDGQLVFFSHDAVEGLHGFDDLRQGQALEYTLYNSPQLRATMVRAAVTRSSPRPAPQDG